MGKAQIVQLESARLEPYARVLCYPNVTRVDLDRKISELSQLGVESIDFRGQTDISGVPIIGKGCVGVVVCGVVKGERVAVKILRSDANRQDLYREAEMLKLANSVAVGPPYLGNSERILIMQYVEGLIISRWATQLPSDKRVIRSVLEKIVDDCFRIDRIGLDHGELSRAPKHVIINDRLSPTILDFETASLNRRPSNVTSICQYLFLGFEVGHRIRDAVGVGTREQIIGALRTYKQQPQLDSLDAVKLACGLKPGNLG